MEREKLLQRQYKMLSCLSGLPRRMLSLHGEENVTEFVLHDLCQQNVFNLTKAAYFVDNPDFNCTKGVAGYSRDNQLDSYALWDDPKDFSERMRTAQFNQQVRQLAHCSLKKSGDQHEDHAKELAERLGFENFAFCTWSMKHDNDGFVLYEKADVKDSFADEHIIDGLSLLSFCPIF